MGGETKLDPTDTYTMTGPSPRGRGNRLTRIDRQTYHRSIPAWAGKPHNAYIYYGREKEVVHPRVGGETAAEYASQSPFRGPSPRGRGNP